MPEVNPGTVIGVRTPRLRALAKELEGDSRIGAFLSDLPHKYYEENNLHAFFVETIMDYRRCVEEIDRFLPYVDNWATCDMMSPRCFKKHPSELISDIERWMSSEHTYTVRFGMEMLMRYYLDDRFEPRLLEMAANIQSGEYYINMMTAWFFATALAKQYDAAVVYLEEGRLPLWVHNKTIQKAVESRRIEPEKKAYLRTLRKNGR